jgi:hypothetical protein
VRWSFEGEGELLWNLDLGRFESYRVAGGESVTTDLVLASRRGGATSKQSMTLAGGLKVTAACPRPGAGDGD